MHTERTVGRRRRLAPKLLRIGLLVALVVILGAAWHYSRQSELVRQLAAQSVLPSGEDAIRELGGIRGTTPILLHIALTPDVIGANRVEAIKVLGTTADGESVVDSLATLLQPHVGLDIRLSVAEVLSRSETCPRQCVMSILHYQERLWRGEANVEDRLIYRTGQSEFARDKALLMRALDGVLVREKETTTAVLREVHGLGVEISEFGLHTIDKLKLQGACPDLLVSADFLSRLRGPFDSALHDRARRVAAALGCK